MISRKIWIYHKTEKPQIIEAKKLSIFEKEGWKNSPLSFLKISDFGMSESDVAGVQYLGETIGGVTDSLNGALNIDMMPRKQLINYVKKHFDKKLDENEYQGRPGLSSLRAFIKDLIEPDDRLTTESGALLLDNKTLPISIEAHA